MAIYLVFGQFRAIQTVIAGVRSLSALAQEGNDISGWARLMHGRTLRLVPARCQRLEISTPVDFCRGAEMATRVAFCRDQLRTSRRRDVSMVATSRPFNGWRRHAQSALNDMKRRKAAHAAPITNMAVSKR